jgi:type I restriction-modification system DNA methylase subunit
MQSTQLNWITNPIWGIADDDLHVSGKYRDVTLPMAVLRRPDSILDDPSGRHSR